MSRGHWCRAANISFNYLFLLYFLHSFLKLSRAMPRNSPRQSNQQLSQWKGSPMTQSILKALCISAVLAASGLTATTVYTFANPAVGGAAMSTTKNIVENAVNSPIHKTLVAAVK